MAGGAALYDGTIVTRGDRRFGVPSLGAMVDSEWARQINRHLIRRGLCMGDLGPAVAVMGTLWGGIRGGSDVSDGGAAGEQRLALAQGMASPNPEPTSTGTV
jgi:hypothetical protein